MNSKSMFHKESILREKNSSFLIHFLFLSVFALSAFISCSNPNLTGTSSGTEAKIAQGSIIQENGTAAAQALVRIIPSRYNPLFDSLPDSATTTTNENGEFELFTQDTGIYNIQANFSDGSCLLIREIHIVEKVTSLPTATLHKPGRIRIKLPVDFDTTNGYVYLQGTDLFVRLHGKVDSVTIDSVPESELLSINYSRLNTSVPQILQSDVIVHSGNTTVVALYNWTFAADLFFNTTVSGANITASVYDFPLLVRLNNSMFNFDQAQSGGEDIRFTKENGSSLPYEIEHWDANNGTAAIWVKMDTIYGNDSSQSITMHWGASTPSAGSEAVTISESNGAKVFDTANGFQGVWHLNNVGKRLPDATANNFEGSINDSSTRTTGVIGNGQSFDSSGGFADIGNVCNPGTAGFTFCAWVKKSAMGKRQTLVSKSKGGSASASYGWLIELDPDGAPILFMASSTGTWGSPGTFVQASDTWITDTAWHHIAVVIDRQRENNNHIYIDGSNSGSLPVSGSTTAGEIANNVPLRFGADGNGNNNWKGSLDEISFSHTSRPKEYIQLLFESQKSTSKLIRIGNTHK